MTKLEAINIILDAIGVYPVTSTESAHPDAVRARQQLARFNNEVQSRGWWFNREPAFVLTPTAVDKEIILPAGTLSADPVDPRLNYVARGNVLYNQTDHTYQFEDQVTVNLITELDFDDLPIALQVYIARSAAMEFAIVREGDQNKITKLERGLSLARSQAFSDELRHGNYNVFSTGLPSRVIAGFNPAVRRY